jgi:hypothetical protein
MTEPKKIARSLVKILDNEVVQMILDRGSIIDPAIERVVGYWGYDLFERKPRPAYDEYGIFQGTDLDLACFMYELAGRGAIINIPEYKSHTQSKQKSNQVLKSKYNRNGVLLGVGANKDFFSFNINMIDNNVISEDKVGDYRTFSLTDKTGAWYEGWKEIQFEPTLKENRFITENALWTGHKIIFNNFIHPNRWISFFGHHYIISKLMIERLEDEMGFLNTEIRRLQADGIKFPKGQGPKKYTYESYGKTERKKFTAFQVKIYMPASQIQGDYEFIPSTQEALVNAYNKVKEYRKAISKLRFMTRASEFAHYNNPDRFPAWIKNANWEADFVEPGKRTKWQRLKIVQPKVGERSVSLLKRTFEKSATVSAD